ncbi:MAG: sigma-70 family RNA polymerase sigma factor [Planctomycetota bacterium]
MTADETAGGDLSATLERARAGDEGAREELFRALYPTVERLVHRGLSQDVRRGRPWLAARFSTGDVVQEVFRRLLADLPSFVGSHERALVGYLAASIRHRLIDAVRFHEASQRDGRRTVVQPEERDPTAHARSPVSDVASIEEIERFQSILQGFPERERLLLRGRIEDDARFQDLAEQLGYSSTSAAKRAFYAAQATLVVRIRQRGDEGGGGDR